MRRRNKNRNAQGLTPAQARILSEIRQSGQWTTCDGRADKPTAVLESYGLIYREVQDGPYIAKGNGASAQQYLRNGKRITCTPVADEDRIAAARAAKGLA